MIRIRTIALALATTFAIGTAPAIAFADDPKHDDAGGEERDRKPQFPLDGTEFKSRVEERISTALARLDRWIEKRELPADVAAQIRADASRVAEKVRASATAAAEDGSVTKQEAQDIRKMVREERRAAMEKYGEYLPQSPKGKGPGKKGKGKGPRGRGRGEGAGGED